jgi:hypothetical protein
MVDPLYRLAENPDHFGKVGAHAEWHGNLDAPHWIGGIDRHRLGIDVGIRDDDELAGIGLD